MRTASTPPLIAPSAALSRWNHRWSADQKQAADTPTAEAVPAAVAAAAAVTQKAVAAAAEELLLLLRLRLQQLLLLLLLRYSIAPSIPLGQLRMSVVDCGSGCCGVQTYGSRVRVRVRMAARMWESGESEGITSPLGGSIFPRFFLLFEKYHQFFLNILRMDSNLGP